jgi:hypothetical protein
MGDGRLRAAPVVAVEFEGLRGVGDVQAVKVDGGPGLAHREAGVREQLFMAAQREVLKVVGVAVVGLHEGRVGVHRGPRPEHSDHLLDGLVGLGEMLEDGLAEDRVDRSVGVGQMMRVSDDVHVGEGADIHVHETWVLPHRTASDRDAQGPGLDSLEDLAERFLGPLSAVIAPSAREHSLCPAR